MLNQMKSIVNRYKNEIKKNTIIGVLFLLLFSSFYPGDEAIKTMFKIFYDSAMAGLFNTINSTDSPGWVLWVTMIYGIFFYYTIVVSGINLGAKVIPTVESDGIDIVLTHPSQPIRTLYVWNYLGAIISLILIILPMYILTAIFSLIFSSGFILNEIAISLIIYFVAGIFFLTITTVASILRFSKSTGKIVGFGFLIFGFIIDLLSGSSQFADYADLSINHYLNPLQVLFSGLSKDNFTDIFNPSLVILLVSVGFFLLGFWRVKSQDFTERVKDLKPNQSKLKISLWERLFDPSTALAKKFPIFMNQMKGNLKTILLLLLFVIFQQYSLFNALPSPDELMIQLAQSNNAVFNAFAQNHELPSNLLGFVILKFYDGLWIYYGLPIALIAAKIPNKDVEALTHDMLFANNITPLKMIRARIVSLIISFSILVWISFFMILHIQATAADFELSFNIQVEVFTILWIHYMGMGIFLVGIALIPKISKGKNLAIIVFIFFIIMAIIPFLNPDIEFLKYLSYLNYFDVVGIIVEEVEFSKALTTSILMLIGSTVFTYAMIKFKFSKADLR